MALTSLFGGRAAGPPISFEVQIYKGERWVTESVCRSEEEARAHGQRILPQHEGIRVVREFTRPDGTMVETVLHTEMRQGGNKKPVAVGQIEEAPVCRKPEEFLGFESRQTITRLLRQYLDEKSLTASELLYNPGEFKRAMNFEALVPGAVARAATLQAKTTGEDLKTRRDDIFDALETLRRKADEASTKTAAANPKQTGLPAAMQVCERAAGGRPEEVEYFAKVMLCRDLANIRNLLGKVEWILGLCGDGVIEAQYMSVLDGLVADALGSSAVVQDMLGRQPSLVAALMRTIDIVEGKFEPQDREQAPAVTALLSRWLGTGRAPESGKVLTEFICRSIRGSQRLSNSEPEGQKASFKTLVARVMGDGGFFGDAQMAEALTLGYLRFIEQGGGEGRRIAIDGVQAMMEAGYQRLRYLILLSQTETGAREMETLVGRIGLLLNNRGGLQSLVPQAVPLKPKMQIMAALYNAMLGSGVPDGERAAFADRIDDHVADYIMAARIVEKLDDPTASLRVRASRLVQFAAADVLASPKARRIVRDQIIGHLRQPNFDGKFVEGLNTPEEKAAALKNFYELLARAQFM